VTSAFQKFVHNFVIWQIESHTKERERATQMAKNTQHDPRMVAILRETVVKLLKFADLKKLIAVLHIIYEELESAKPRRVGRMKSPSSIVSNAKDQPDRNLH
jgi:hypothetical protein